jgi:hypothetical protein
LRNEVWIQAGKKTNLEEGEEETVEESGGSVEDLGLDMGEASKHVEVVVVHKKSSPAMRSAHESWRGASLRASFRIRGRELVFTFSSELDPNLVSRRDRGATR